MLFIAEGRLEQPINSTDHHVAAAWLGPMVDSGFLQSGYLGAKGRRVLLVLSAPDEEAVTGRLNDLPIVRNGSVVMSISVVKALRFS